MLVTNVLKMIELSNFTKTVTKENSNTNAQIVSKLLMAAQKSNVMCIVFMEGLLAMKSQLLMQNTERITNEIVKPFNKTLEG